MFTWFQMYLTHGHPLDDWVNLHRGWLRFIRRAILIYLVALLVGLWFNTAGHQEVNALFGFVFMAVGIPFLLPGNILAAGIIGFFLGQPGNAPGLSIADGVATAGTLVHSLFRATGITLFYGSMPFYAMFIFSFKEHALSAITLLAFAIPVSLGAGMIFYAKEENKGGFFMKLVYWIEVLVLVVALGTTLTETYYHYMASAQEQLVRDADKADAGIDTEADKKALEAILKKVSSGKVRIKDLTGKEAELYQKYTASLESKSPVGIANKAVAIGKQAATSVSAVGHDLFYNVSVDKEVTSLQNLMVCGIQAGTRKFEVVPGGTVVINGENTDIRSALRINGALPKTRFEVNQTECVVMSFAVSNDFKNYSFEPIMLTIKFN